MPIVNPDTSVATDQSHHRFSKFLNKLTGQPTSYAKKQDYIYGRTLGAGAMGVVRQARHVPSGEDVAIKIILKKTFKGNEQQIYDELSLLGKCNHPNIIKFKDWFESKDKFYIVTQLAIGGELFDRIVEKGKFVEDDARSIIKQVLGALIYLHEELEIVHRDLKPENLLYVSKSDDSELVLADFGIAKQLDTSDQLIYSAAGSLGYCAPEVLTANGHGKPCDVWSLGVICYTLLVGYSPFRSENVNDFLQEVQTEPVVVFHRDYWRGVSQDAKDFILRCLTLDPYARATAQELMCDKWMVKEQTSEGEDLLPSIKKFNAKKKFIQAVEIVKLKNRINKLRALEPESDQDDEDFQYGGFSSSSDSSEVDVSSSPQHSSMDLSRLANALKTVRDSKGSSASVNSDPGSNGSKQELKSQLNANLFQQVVRAATMNPDRVKGYSNKEGDGENSVEKGTGREQ
ncbi:hypothetical protein WICPIJ_002699 [Wickerhamomyces pijperi]|uniref:calcium/calmodulin-dependent protein kinase n=1 Tax=Wickerhamomyces pijperi TaxID=599730 RepID=A0A9P8QB75_WICPI|nr:hypothetical protein WICPIJ_002699 [Wickerhamomyces pijperi]